MMAETTAVKVRPIAVLPENGPSPQRGRAPVYEAKLNAIKAAVKGGTGGDDGEWFELANFATKRGAANAANRIKKGETKVPPGRWEFETRFNDAGSVLYCRPKPKKAATA